GNTLSGITISGATATSNVVQGNYIGTNAAGTADLGNVQRGIYITAGANGNTIGGTAALARNVISGNDMEGILLDGVGTTGNRILGNYIGVNATATAEVGNGQEGIQLMTGAHGNTIGGSAGGAGNVIGGNDRGVAIDGVNNTVVYGNFIGTDVAGTTDLGNANWGVEVRGGATGSTIGGVNSGEGNRIAFNGQDGVWVQDPTTANNRIIGNAIYSNLGLGIDLEANGITANDAGDADSGPNYLQNYPVIDVATVSGGTVTIGGYFRNSDASRTRANSTYTIHFYANPAASAGREGRTYLGSTTVPTDASGDGTFASLPLAFTGYAVGDRITATATMTSSTGGFGAEIGSTSEFSASFVTTPPGNLTIAATTHAAEPGTNGQFTVTLSQASATGTVIAYTATGTATPGAGNDYTTLSGSVTILAGATTATINVAVLNDLLLESTETVIVTLDSITSGAPGITIGGTNAATVNITDNDAATANLSVTTHGVEGGTNIVYTVTLTQANSTGGDLT
ncbi:MAG: beta strand repeat-containing protein, partial [Candidatus Binatia bacterium]